MREGHQCLRSFQEAGSSFEKNEYATRFSFREYAYTKKMQKLCLNLYQGAYRSQRVNVCLKLKILLTDFIQNGFISMRNSLL